MKRVITASVYSEGQWYVAQALDVASQGMSEDETLANLAEVLQLYFESPTATVTPRICRVEVEVAAP